jgi:putative flippase GtrA
MILFIKRLIRFGLISGIGFICDLLAYFLFLSANFDPFNANILSSALAVSFVYMVAGRFIFIENKLTLVKYIFWLLYQLVNIILFSFIISMLVNIGIHPIISKLIIIPFSFFLNYMAMKLILNKA